MRLPKQTAKREAPLDASCHRLKPLLGFIGFGACMSEVASPPAKPELRDGGPPVRPPELPEEAVLLRIFLGEDDRHRHLPLYEAIVLKAREKHLAGATVLRGPLGFGKSSHLHTARGLRLSRDLPMVIEIVDTPEKISAFLPELDGMMKSGLVTLERAQVIRYEHAPQKRPFG
jgi:PII-like signaling protein